MSAMKTLLLLALASLVGGRKAHDIYTYVSTLQSLANGKHFSFSIESGCSPKHYEIIVSMYVRLRDRELGLSFYSRDDCMHGRQKNIYCT